MWCRHVVTIVVVGVVVSGCADPQRAHWRINSRNGRKTRSSQRYSWGEVMSNLAEFNSRRL